MNEQMKTARWVILWIVGILAVVLTFGWAYLGLPPWHAWPIILPTILACMGIYLTGKLADARAAEQRPDRQAPP